MLRDMLSINGTRIGEYRQFSPHEGDINRPLVQCHGPPFLRLHRYRPSNFARGFCLSTVRFHR
jgi:hypothetical protein